MFLMFVLVFQVTSFGNIPLAQAQSAEELERERIQLEKERKSLDEKLQTIESQINELSAILDDLRGSITEDKIREMEEQLAELYDDKSNLQEDERDLLERESIFEEKWKESEIVVEETTPSEPAAIPNWFKSNAKWWKQGLISDGEIINALESLIIQDVIPLDNFVKTSQGLEHAAGVSPGGTFVDVSDRPKIPSFQKDVFGFWSDGIVSDAEIVNSIGYLMTEGIINSAKIQTEIAEKRSLLTKSQDSTKQEYSETESEDGVITERFPDGTKKMTFPDGSYTEFYTDGSRTTFFPNPVDYEDSNEIPKPLWGLWDGIPTAEREFSVNRVHTDADGWRTFYEADTIVGEITPDGERTIYDHSLKKYEETDEWEDPSSGGMEQLTQVTAMTIDGVQYPISQFTIWKWTGECDDAWHYHPSFGQAVSIDGITGIVDPDQDNCGFGKVGQVFIGLAFMTQDEIDKFREKTGTDPLSNEAMHGGSDDGTSPSEPTSVDPTPGPVSIEESDLPFTKLDSTDLNVHDFTDSDNDGIADEIDTKPNEPSKEFGSVDGSLPGKIIDDGGNKIKVIHVDDGTVIIEVGSESSTPATVEVLGIELELDPGTIIEADFG